MQDKNGAGLPFRATLRRPCVVSADLKELFQSLFALITLGLLYDSILPGDYFGANDERYGTRCRRLIKIVLTK